MTYKQRSAHQLFLRCLFGLCALPLLLAGCADFNAHADAMAKPAGLHRDLIVAGPFVLTTFYRTTQADQPLAIYIEGDGLAWFSRNQPSDNPTPHLALGLALAAADPAANVVYLARPCQFTPVTEEHPCDVTYWTSKRYAEEVVAAMDQAITRYKKADQKIALIGYSGGGALAVLVAARRNDVTSLRTVAGNLDQAEVNRLHRVSAMPESLNAIDVARKVASIPQIHFSGADDTIVPPAIAQRFVTAAEGTCAQARVIKGMSHESDWSRLWPGLLAIRPTCGSGITKD